MSFLTSLPEPVSHLNHIHYMLIQKKPFTFIRFSDGETEIILNRKLEIYNGKTIFKGKKSKNIYPKFDNKKFDPRLHQSVRKDLISAATSRGEFLYKGLPSRHNRQLWERDLMLRLNGGLDKSITFSDLLINSNYKTYRNNLVPLYRHFEDIYVVANYRSVLIGELIKATLIPVQDNFFENYDAVKSDIYERIIDVPYGALVLSSASSLTKIIGHLLYKKRPDITFIDIGTSINDLLSLKYNTRAYHNIFYSRDPFKLFFNKFINIGNKIKW